MSKENLYTSGARYYDLLVAKKDVQKEIKFIIKLFHRFKIRSMLDVGCGTGLYLIPLKKAGFDAEGLDLSSAMLKEALNKEKSLKIYQKKYD